MKIFIVVLLSVFGLNLWGWGPVGHSVIAGIAEQRLNEQGKKLVKDLLENKEFPSKSKTLPDVSSYMDELRSDDTYKYTSTYHYVNIPDEKTYYTSEKEPKGDVVRAICNYYEQLRSIKTPTTDRQFALKAIVHFVGDLHQPLHVGKKEDRGGTDIQVKWFGKGTNLHKVWDQELIRSKELSYTEYEAFIYKPGPELDAMANASLTDQIKESYEARAQIYNNKEKDLNSKYIFDNIDLVNKRLLQGGIHLAAFINKAADGIEDADCTYIIKNFGELKN